MNHTIKPRRELGKATGIYAWPFSCKQDGYRMDYDLANYPKYCVRCGVRLDAENCEGYDAND